MNLRKSYPRIIGCASMLAVIAIPLTALAAESNWSGSETIDELELVDTYAWLRLEGWTGEYDLPGATGCSSTYGFSIDNDDGGFESRYRTLLAAQLAGRQVRLRVEPDSGNPSVCRVTRVMLD